MGFGDYMMGGISGAVQSLANIVTSVWGATCGLFSWIRDHAMVCIAPVLMYLGTVAWVLKSWLDKWPTLKGLLEGFYGVDWESNVALWKAVSTIEKINYVLPVDHVIYAVGALIIFAIHVAAFKVVKMLLF